MTPYGLGRLPAPDERDHGFLLTRPAITRTARFWWGYKTRLDQNGYPQCVAYAWSHFITDAPRRHLVPLLDPADLYHQAQLVDEWPGEDYDGTSVRAGAKVLAALAAIETEYRWAFDLDTLVANLLEVGPVVLGVNWYEAMFDPDKDNFVRIGGDVAGGHAIKADGVNVVKRFVRIKNSWRNPDGSWWGRGSFARISFDDMERLLDEQGEACMAVEKAA